MLLSSYIDENSLGELHRELLFLFFTEIFFQMRKITFHNIMSTQRKVIIYLLFLYTIDGGEFFLLNYFSI